MRPGREAFAAGRHKQTVKGTHHAPAEAAQVKPFPFIAHDGQGRAKAFHSPIFGSGKRAPKAEVEAPAAIIVFAVIRRKGSGREQHCHKCRKARQVYFPHGCS